MLLDDSIKNNVNFGKEEIVFNKINKVIEQVKLSSFIKSLPNRLNTIIGENAAFLSGGQIQRVVIARALYGKKILIMDESTNELNKKTEKEIFSFIKDNLQVLTVIIISHQLESLNICNKIMVI